MAGFLFVWLQLMASFQPNHNFFTTTRKVNHEVHHFYSALVQKHFPDATKMVAAPAQAELNLQPVIDMERIRQTMAAANEVAAKVQSVVFFELLNGKKNWQNERWCLSFSADGRNDTAPPTPRAWQIESDAVIAPLLKLASDLGEEGGMLLATTSELLALASASTQSLSRRLAA